MKIGNKIKQIRIEKGLTQKQLGDMCVPPLADSAIRRYENGKVEPRMKAIWAIADALGVSTFDLIDVPETESTEKINRIKLAFDYIDGITVYQKISKSLDKLNDKGLTEACKQVELLTKIPEYRKDTEE